MLGRSVLQRTPATTLFAQIRTRRPSTHWQRLRPGHERFTEAARPIAPEAAVRGPEDPSVTLASFQLSAPSTQRGEVSMKTDPATLKRVYAMSLAGVYPHYIAKAEKKGRTKAEVDQIIRWLTGYTQKQLDAILEKRTNIETFISKAKMNPSRTLVTGAICGVRVEEIEDPVMQGVRYLDKLIDELAKGRPMEKILRKPSSV
jgi:hypothetical protein